MLTKEYASLRNPYRMVITVDEYAVLTRTSRASVYRAVKDGRIPKVGATGKIGIPMSFAADQLGVDVNDIRNAIGLIP
jgi:hypothetical protein